MNYPKMLYKGNQEKYQTIIADDEDHESELADQGWHKYGELLERESGMTDPYMGDSARVGNASGRGSSVSQVEYDALIVERDQLQIEHTAFKNDVDAMKARIAELEPISTLGNVLNQVNYSELSVKDLQNLLDEKQIKYLKNDNKATLLALLH